MAMLRLQWLFVCCLQAVTREHYSTLCMLQLAECYGHLGVLFSKEIIQS
ncbi:hypothetical protein M758_4G152200 [Ceratodon purpureus]|nr:hypothetical protein M758_4G152200 [Ceratodon purpureus]